MKSIIAMLILILLGCQNPCATHIDMQWQRDQIGPVTLFTTKDTSPRERALIVEAATLQIAFWKKDWGKPTLPVSVFVFRSNSVPCSGEIGEKFYGCYSPSTKRSWMIMGRMYELPALYHELCHRNLPTGSGHKDSRWERLWRPRQWELNNILRNKRNKLKLF